MSMIKSACGEAAYLEAKALMGAFNWCDSSEGYRHWATKYWRLMTEAGMTEDVSPVIQLVALG
jgi:hypothetical protein